MKVRITRKNKKRRDPRYFLHENLELDQEPGEEIGLEVEPEVKPDVDIEDASEQNIIAHDARLDFIEGFLKREFPEFKPGREEW